MIGSEFDQAVKQDTTKVMSGETDERLLTVVENAGRKDLTEFERALALKILQEENGFKPFEIIKMTGIKKGTAYNLLRAYEKSPPALRDLFQAGLSPRAVLELQSVFEKIPEDEQDIYAKQLEGINTSTAEAIRKQVETGVSPEEALAFVKIMSQTKTRPKAAEPSKQKKEIADKAPKKAPLELDKNTFSIFVNITGVSEERVEALAKHIRGSANIGEVLLTACLFMAKSDGTQDEQQVIALSEKAFASRKMRAALSQHVRNVQKASSLIKGLDGLDLKKFTSTLFGVPYE